MYKKVRCINPRYGTHSVTNGIYYMKEGTEFSLESDNVKYAEYYYKDGNKMRYLGILKTKRFEDMED